MKNALVLSGGGAKGAFQIGALEVLIEEKKIDFEVLCGVSVGALNAASLAQARFIPKDAAKSRQNLALQFRKLRKLWLHEIKGNPSIYRDRIGGAAGIIGGADSVYEPQGLGRLLRTHLDPRKLLRSGRTLKIGAVNLDKGKYVGVDPTAVPENRIRDYVMASATMPYYFPPVEIDDDWWADGGIRDVTPLSDAFKTKPSRIYAIFCSPLGRVLPPKEIHQGFLGLKANAFTFLGRTVEILVDEVYNTDMEGADKWNDVILAWKELRKQVPAGNRARKQMDAALQGRHAAEIIRIEPTEQPVTDPLEFKPGALLEAYEHGKERARKI